MKVLVCAESELVREAIAMTLRAGGLAVASSADPFALAAQAGDAQAALVDAARGKQCGALLRDRGFAGRAFLIAEGPLDEAETQARELHLDGAVALTPEEGLPDRLQAALERRRRVLVVDDSEIVARLIGKDLEARGMEVQYASDAEKATSIILKRATRPDLILLDINMPKVDGAQFCRFVKRNEMFKSIKVLFCSGEDREKVSRLVEECGADGFVLKNDILGKWIAENLE